MNGAKWLACIAAATALTTVLLCVPPADAARDVSSACTSSIPEDDFTDTGDAGSPLESAVDCITAYGFTSGTTATTYDPPGNVSRAQMATFAMNVLDAVRVPRPGNPPDAFTDDEGSVHEVNINDAAALGVVAGTGGGLYDPRGEVSRAQMATFLVNTMDAAGVAVPTTIPSSPFADIAGNTHEDNIKIVADDAGWDLADGTTATTYSPGNPMSRGQMAFFLSRGADLLVDEGRLDAIVPPVGNQHFPSDVTVATILTESTTTGKASQIVTFRGFAAAATVDVTLAPCYEVAGEAGTVTFVDDFEYDGDWDKTAFSSGGLVEIAELNGTAQAPGVASVDSVAVPAGGSVAVRVELQDAFVGLGDCARVLVFVDADADNEVEVDLQNHATDPYGISAPIVWTAGEAPDGSDPAGAKVVFVDDADAGGHAGMVVTSDGFTYFWDATDAFTYDTGSFTLTLDEWERFLSDIDKVDLVGAGYSRSAANAFDLFEDDGYPDGVPTGVSATAGDFDADAVDTGANDVRVTFTTPAQGIDPEENCVDIYSTANTATVRSDDTFIGAACGAGNPSSLVVEDVGPGTFLAYAYVNVSAEGGASPLSTPSPPVTAAA